MYLLQVVSQESLPQLCSSQGRAGNFFTRPGIDPGTARMISATIELIPCHCCNRSSTNGVSLQLLLDGTASWTRCGWISTSDPLHPSVILALVATCLALISHLLGPHQSLYHALWSSIISSCMISLLGLSQLKTKRGGRGKNFWGSSL